MLYKRNHTVRDLLRSAFPVQPDSPAVHPQSVFIADQCSVAGVPQRGRTSGGGPQRLAACEARGCGKQSSTSLSVNLFSLLRRPRAGLDLSPFLAPKAPADSPAEQPRRFPSRRRRPRDQVLRLLQRGGHGRVSLRPSGKCAAAPPRALIYLFPTASDAERLLACLVAIVCPLPVSVCSHLFPVF